MTDINPTDIFNDFKDGKVDVLTTVEKLLAIVSDIRDENLAIEASKILLEMYKTAETDGNEKSEHLKSLIERKLGNKFISKYNIIPSEAMALGLVELIIRVELDNEDEIQNIHHVHAAFRLKDRHVIDLDIVEMTCPKVTFIDLFPNLEFLRISQASLQEIKGLKKLHKLRWLDLSANNLTEIEGVTKLNNLEKLLISYNPLVRLDGIKNLINLEDIELEETNLPKLQIEQIKNRIKKKKSNSLQQ